MKLNPIYAMFLAAGLGGWTAAALAQDSVDVGEVEVTGQNLGNGQGRWFGRKHLRLAPR